MQNPKNKKDDEMRALWKRIFIQRQHCMTKIRLDLRCRALPILDIKLEYYLLNYDTFCGKKKK